MVSVAKTSFASHTKQAVEATQRSTSFMRDNIQFWILEQMIESVPWCNEKRKRKKRSR